MSTGRAAGGHFFPVKNIHAQNTLIATVLLIGYDNRRMQVAIRWTEPETDHRPRANFDSVPVFLRSGPESAGAAFIRAIFSSLG